MTHRTALLALLVLLLTACDGINFDTKPLPPIPTDGSGDLNDCGGSGQLSDDGSPALPGDGCGACDDGLLFCTGPDQLSCSGGTRPNSCGGCSLLPGTPGTPCGSCGDGLWACAAGTATCIGAGELNDCGGCAQLSDPPGATCLQSSGAEGVTICATRETTLCLEPTSNACGGTGLLTLPDGVTGVTALPGTLYDSGCRRGVLFCDDGALTAVDLEGGNACGGCEPLAAEPGTACNACGATWTCNADGNLSCRGQGELNACGGCTTLALEVGTSCDNGEGSVLCLGPDEAACITRGSTNACGGLGPLTGLPLGEPCGTCLDGRVACDPTDPRRTTTRCDGASESNACGGCGLLSGPPESLCGTCGSGRLTCAGGNSSVTCDGDAGDSARNACGGCGTLRGEPGSACGRCGQFACDETQPGRLTCVEPIGGCNASQRLGAVCSDDAACISGNCATEPDGTSQDRCAPAGMVFIPAGSFLMGSPEAEAGRDPSETQHTVTLTRSFFIDKTETSQGAWKTLSGGLNPSFFQSPTGTATTTENNFDAGPVERLDWFSALAFANVRSTEEGLPTCYTLLGCTDARNGWQDGTHSGCSGATLPSGTACTGYRLPTESEWEYAARAGTSSTFPWGMLEDANFLWFASNSEGRTQPVGTRLPNAWGLRDTIGNVWEWTWDAFGPYPGDVTDPTGASEGFARAVRGGGYSSDGQFIRVAVHDQNTWDAANETLGFRLVRTLP